MSVSGPAKFGSFLEKNGISKRKAAKALGVSAPTILDWLNEAKNPEHHNRTKIRVYTKGEVHESDWETQAERDHVAEIAAVRPFDEPAPTASESGEHPAICVTGTHDRSAR